MRKSKCGNLCETSAHDSKALTIDSAGEGIVSLAPKSVSGGVCCSCSRTSTYKTTKFQCRTSGGSCGASCGCVPSKCSNRGSALLEAQGMPEVETAEGATGNNEEKNQFLACEGAKLLENALIERPSEITDDGKPRRKVLSEIGNSLAKSNAQKPIQRKKWRKSTLEPSQPATAEAPQRLDTVVPEPTIPMKLPRAMRSAASNAGNPFKERNSDKAEQFEVNKEAGVPAPRSSLPQNKTSDEKENCGL